MIIDNFSVETLFLTIIGLVVLWILVSIPVWYATKAVTGIKTSFGEASMATLAGPIVYFSVTFSIDLVIGTISGSVAFLFGYILALITWIWTFKDDFRTDWIPTILIALLAWIVFIASSVIVGFVFRMVCPTPFFPEIIF